MTPTFWQRLANVFVHPTERRLRAGFRMVVLALVIIVFAVPASFAARALRLDGIGAILSLNFVVLVPAISLVAWLIDRRSLRELGVGAGDLGAWIAVLWGAVLGGALIGLVALIEALTGLASYRWLAPAASDVAMSLGVFAMVAVHEELLFRGYLLTNLAEALGGTERTRVRGLIGAIVLSSLGFGAAHLSNPNPSALGLINIVLAGVFLSLPYLLRGDLGASIGLHFGWNLAQCWLGMAVSGNDIAGAWVVREVEPGQDLWTGGAFGAEGGILGMAALIVGTLALLPLSRIVRDPLRAAALGLPPARAHPPKAGPDAPSGAPELGG